MALLKPSPQQDKQQVRINIDSKVVEDARAYCEYAGIKRIDEFFEKAAELVFKKDKNWQKEKVES